MAAPELAAPSAAVASASVLVRGAAAALDGLPSRRQEDLVAGAQLTKPKHREPCAGLQLRDLHFMGCIVHRADFSDGLAPDPRPGARRAWCSSDARLRQVSWTALLSVSADLVDK